MSRNDDELVRIIAKALREKFGDAAPDVAAFQAEAASDRSLETWRAVIRALSMH